MVHCCEHDGNQQPVEVYAMYEKLQYVILPMFYERPQKYAEVMRSAIAVNGSFFNTQRMVAQYLVNAYLLEGARDKKPVKIKTGFELSG